MRRIYVTPRSGLKVRDPFKKDLLPPDGREVIQDTYWLNRLRDGDVTLGKPKAEPAKGEKSGKAAA